MIEIQAPNLFPDPHDKPWIFLAGSIEMDAEEDWQSRVVQELSELDVVILNPRRKDWDSSWVQEKSNPQFSEQVNWELAGLYGSDLALFYFQPGTQSPISLLELGLQAVAPDKVMVICPDGFWRKGNVDITCDSYGFRQFASLDEAVDLIKRTNWNKL